MKSILIVLIMAMAVATAGCAARKAVSRTGPGNGGAVIQEVTPGGKVPRGYADLEITLSLKTHRPGLYSGEDRHGTGDYQLQVDLDGEPIRLSGSLWEEKVEAHALRDPEGGEGVRYYFTKTVRLKAGDHQVVLALPADDLSVDREITLAEQTSNRLTLEPVYRGGVGAGRSAPHGSASFKEGMRGFWISLNGAPI
ncbi:lipoprotein [Geomonas sp. Red276]